LNNLLNDSNNSSISNDLNDEFHPWKKTDSSNEGIFIKQINTRNDIGSRIQNNIKPLMVVKTQMNLSNFQKMNQEKHLEVDRLKSHNELSNSLSIKTCDKNERLNEIHKNNILNFDYYKSSNKINMNYDSENCYNKCKSNKNSDSIVLPKLHFTSKNHKNF